MAAVAGKLVCPRHPKAAIIDTQHDGDRVCDECGLVVDRIINEGEDWRSFSNSEKSGGAADPSRVGEVGDVLLKDNELTTYISQLPGGTELSWANWQNRGTGAASKNKSLQTSFRYLGQLCNRLGLAGAALDQVKYKYKEVDEKSAGRGRSNEVIAATCLYLVCRERSYPRTLKEICAVSGKERRDISRCLKKINQVMGGSSVACTDPSQLLPRYCSELRLSREVARLAEHIAKAAKDLNLIAGRQPISVSAAAIYLAAHVAGMPKEMRSITMVTGAAETTIRSVYNDLYPAKEYLFPQDYKFRTRLSAVPNHGPSALTVDFAGKAADLGIRPVLGEPIKDEPAVKQEQ